jgi:predicted nucleotidyltransferase
VAMISFNNRLRNFAQNELVLGRNETERHMIDNSISFIQQNIISELNKSGSKILRFEVFGSFDRNTILPRYYNSRSDVDIMVVMNYKRNDYTPETFRNWILKACQITMPRSTVYKSHPTVSIENSNIAFDLVPTIVENTWFAGNQIYIPASQSQWMSTNPRDIKDKLINANQTYGDNTVRCIIRLCKLWNCKWNYQFESYALESELLKLNYSGHDVYSGFKYALNAIAGHYNGVADHLKWISEYERRNEPNKVLERLRKLLPGLP